MLLLKGIFLLFVELDQCFRKDSRNGRKTTKKDNWNGHFDDLFIQLLLDPIRIRLHSQTLSSKLCDTNLVVASILLSKKVLN